MITSILQESNSPTLERESKCSTKLIYDDVTNIDGKKINITIKCQVTGSHIVEYNYEPKEIEGIPANFLREMVEEIIEQRTDCKI